MWVIEESARWDKFIHPFAVALDFAFGCRHTNLSRVFTIEGKSYKVCCDCGAHFNYSLDKMSVVHRRASRRALRLLRMRHI
jgi:hypothetical protein